MADAPISEELTALKKRARRRLVGAVALVLVALVILWSVMDDKPPQSLANQPVAIVSSEPALSSPATSPGKPADAGETAAPPAVATPVPPSPDAAPSQPLQSTSESKPGLAALPSAVVTPQPKPVASPVVSVRPVPKPSPVAEVQAKKVDKADKVEKSDRTEKTEKAEKVAANSNVAKKPASDPARILAGLDDQPAAKHTESAHPSESLNHFFLQLGAFADSDKAKSLVSKAAAAGVTVQREVVSTDKGELSRLRAGPYSSHEAAEHARAKLADAGLSATVVGK